MRHEHSKSYNKQFVRTAVHLNSYSTLCLWLLHCCVAIRSHPRGLPYVLFLLLYVAVCVHRAYPVYCRVLCTCHNNMYVPRSARSEIYATLRYHVSYHTSTFELYTYTYAREFEPGWSAPFLLFLDLPSFCQFCRLALSGFYRLTRLSGFLVVIFS